MSPTEQEYELILSKIRNLVEEGRGETIFEASPNILETRYFCNNSTTNHIWEDWETPIIDDFSTLYFKTGFMK